MTYLRNTWYVAAWDREVIAGKLLSRRLLDEPVVLFRDANGAACALHAVCPHRMASLGRGQCIDGTVQCGYHGLRFDGSGKCVHNPFGDAVPHGAKVRAYPLVERYSLLWIWMGEANLADEALLPDFSFQDPAHWAVGKDYLNVRANYELEIENILDLSHIEFLHATTLGSSEVSNARYEAKQEGEEVWSNRDITGEVMSPGLGAAMGIAPGTLSDRWIHVRWTAPANLVIFAGAVPTGRPRAEGRETPTCHFFTPETARTSHYWFGISFPKAMPQAQEIADQQVAFLRMPFETEDLPMLEDQQANLGNTPLHEHKLCWLPGDAAGARARKLLHEKIAAEQAAAGLSPA